MLYHFHQVWIALENCLLTCFYWPKVLMGNIWLVEPRAHNPPLVWILLSSLGDKTVNHEFKKAIKKRLDSAGGDNLFLGGGYWVWPSEAHVPSWVAVGSRYGPGNAGNLGLSNSVVRFHTVYPGANHGNTRRESSFRLDTLWEQGPCLSDLPLYSPVPQYMNKGMMGWTNKLIWPFSLCSCKFSLTLRASNLRKSLTGAVLGISS